MEHAELTGQIIGAAMSVHNEIGNGFREKIYQRALALQLEDIGLTFNQEVSMNINFKGQKIGSRRVDFLVEEFILVEIKAVSILEDVHLNQIINYCQVFNFPFGLLINFGSPRMEFKRAYNLSNKNK